MSLPFYTDPVLKRELNFCNGYLSLLYFCLKHILSATSAQIFRFLWFMPSLGVRSPWNYCNFQSRKRKLVWNQKKLHSKGFAYEHCTTIHSRPCLASIQRIKQKVYIRYFKEIGLWIYHNLFLILFKTKAVSVTKYFVSPALSCSLEKSTMSHKK